MAEDIGLDYTSNYFGQDECEGKTIKETVSTRQRCLQSWKTKKMRYQESQGDKKECCGKTLGTSTAKTRFSQKGNQFWHRMNIRRNEGNEIYGMQVNKVSLSSFDTKHWIRDNCQ